MPYLFLLFVLMPIVEIALLIKVGSAIGALNTIGIVVLTAMIGTIMLRQQGLATLNMARARMQSGEVPAQQLLEGILLVVGGVLLLTPGFVTDAFGFLCLIPFTRRYLAGRIAGFGQFRVASGRFRRPSDSVPPGSRDSGNDILEGEFRREDP